MQFKVGNRFLERFPSTNPPYEVIITSVDTDRGCVKIHYHGWNARYDTERTFGFCKDNWIPCTNEALEKAKEGQKEAAKRQQQIAAARRAKAREKATQRHSMEAVKRKARPRAQTETVKGDRMLRLQTEAVKGKARPRSQTETVTGDATLRFQTETVKGDAAPRSQTEAVKEKAKRRLQTEVMSKVITKRSGMKIPLSKSLTTITPATTITYNVSLPKQLFLRAMQMQDEVMGSPSLRKYTIEIILREYLKTYHYLEKDDQEKAGAAQMLVDMFNVHCYEILSKAELANYLQAVSTSKDLLIEHLLPSSYFAPEHLFRFIAKQLTFVMQNDENWTKEKKVAIFMNMPYFVKFMSENGGRYFA